MEQMIKSARRLRRAIVDSLAEIFGGSMLLSSLLSGLVSLLLATYSPAEGIAPFGIGCAVGVWYAGVSPYFACIGAFAGHLIGRTPAYAVASLLLLSAIYVIDRKVASKRLLRLLAGFAVEITVLIAASAIGGTPLVFAFGASSVSVLTAVIIGQGIRSAGLLASKRELNDAELLALAAGAGLITLSFGNTQVLGQSPGMIFAGVCSLMLAYRCGAASVAFAATAAAGRVLVTGGDMRFMAVLSASVLISSALRSLGKAAVTLGFAATNAVFLIFMRGTSLFSVFETAVCCIAFMAIPRSLYMPYGSSPAAEPRQDARYNSIQYSVSGIADVLCGLARVYGGDLGQMLGCVSDTLQRTVSGGGTRDRALFRAETGVAADKKSDSSRSGDSYAVKQTERGLLLCISDGMGSGDEACRQSRETVGLLCDLITVGFDMQGASECINRLMALRARDDMYSTLDAMLIDAGEGTGKLIKLGAPASYVLRRGKLYTLYAENLPVGITEEADAQVRRIAFKKGDEIIMMSDGAVDGLGSSLTAALTDCADFCGSVQEAAEAVLERAAQNGAADDMTVIWTRLK